MRVDIVNGHLEVTESETDPWRQKRERLALPYAEMRSALVGGHGTSLTAIDDHTTRIETGNGKLAEVKAAMETLYAKAMKALERYGNEVDVTEDLA